MIHYKGEVRGIKRDLGGECGEGESARPDLEGDVTGKAFFGKGLGTDLNELAGAFQERELECAADLEFSGPAVRGKALEVGRGLLARQIDARQNQIGRGRV
ncbi:MAG: hypothetical protein SFV51_21890, partial [Bryobacteraceae bacterium]|nr:hypothetical protein [Bryobacteraceae bacterium]